MMSADINIDHGDSSRGTMGDALNDGPTAASDAVEPAGTAGTAWEPIASGEGGEVTVLCCA
jgi:hypothetical protein